jgi:hypothetical protein
LDWSRFHRCSPTADFGITKVSTPLANWRRIRVTVIGALNSMARENRPQGRSEM